jgi:hypothetical protein
MSTATESALPRPSCSMSWLRIARAADDFARQQDWKALGGEAGQPAHLLALVAQLQQAHASRG